jgi:hypothetical protein
MDHRQLVRGLATGRVVVGAALLLAPGAAGGRWIGDAARRTEVKVVSRAFGVRDLALGLGTLQALDADAPAEPWVTLGVLCDAADLVATAFAIRALGLKRALPVMAVAGGAAALGYAARTQVD